MIHLCGYVWFTCVATCGSPVWVTCVIHLCGYAWVPCVGPLCGSPVWVPCVGHLWVPCVGPLCGFPVWVTCGSPVWVPCVQVLVGARDGGRPPLTGTLTVMVTVSDINDNYPVFDKYAYNVNVSETTRTNDPLLKVR